MKLELETEPSTDWTPAERLAVIARLSVAMQNTPKQREIHSSCVREVSERIALVATMGPHFLEANRAELLGDFSL